MENETVKCFYCDCLTDDYLEADGEFYCVDCYNDLFVECDECSDIIMQDHAHWAGDYVYCNYCYEQNFTPCANCGEMTHNDGLINTADGDVCRDCVDYYYYSCGYCGTLTHERYMMDNACENCYDAAGAIHSYSYDPPEFLFYDCDWLSGGYGVELEVDDEINNLSSSELRDIARTLTENMPNDLLYCKSDGSLENGFEIVTHPCSANFHVNEFPWDDIQEKITAAGLRSHDTSTCGLHIHASRSLLGSTLMERDLTAAKIIILIDRWYDRELLKFSRRDLEKMEKWAGKNGIETDENDDEQKTIDKAKDKGHETRYKAVNIRNTNTIEFRFFKGTLKASTIRASILWIEHLINWCRKNDLKTVHAATWKIVFNGVHPLVKSYMDERRI